MQFSECNKGITLAKILDNFYLFLTLNKFNVDLYNNDLILSGSRIIQQEHLLCGAEFREFVDRLCQSIGGVLRVEEISRVSGQH